MLLLAPEPHLSGGDPITISRVVTQNLMYGYRSFASWKHLRRNDKQ